MNTIMSVQNPNFSEDGKSLPKFLEPSDKPKVIDIDNSLTFGKACEDLSWNHRVSTLQRSETNDIAERAVRRICEQNTFSHSMYRCAHCVRTSYCTQSLYHIRGSRNSGLCAQNSLRLLRSVSRHAQNTQHFTLHFSNNHWSPKVDHVQNPLRRSTRTQG